MTASKCNIFTKLSVIISVANFPIKFQIGKIGSNWKIEKIIYSTNLSSCYDQRANHALNENARLIRVYQTKRSSFLFTLTLTNYNKTRESWIFTTWSMKREIMIAELWHHFFFFIIVLSSSLRQTLCIEWHPLNVQSHAISGCHCTLFLSCLL